MASMKCEGNLIKVSVKASAGRYKLKEKKNGEKKCAYSNITNPYNNITVWDNVKLTWLKIVFQICCNCLKIKL